MEWANGNESKIQKQPPEVFCRKGVLRDFAKFAATTFYNFLQLYNFTNLQLFLKKRLWHRCFRVNFAKIFKDAFSYSIPLVAAS